MTGTTTNAPVPDCALGVSASGVLGPPYQVTLLGSLVRLVGAVQRIVQPSGLLKFTCEMLFDAMVEAPAGEVVSVATIVRRPFLYSVLASAPEVKSGVVNSAVLM